MKHKNAADLLDRVKQRQVLRDQLQGDDFGPELRKRMYTKLKQVDAEMHRLHEIFQKKHKKPFFYKNVDLNDVIFGSFCFS